MGDEDKKQLEQKLWDIANELRGKMDADEFRDYILGFIFYKYLSEKMASYGNKLLAEDGITYLSLDENSADGAEYLDAIKDESVEKLGYFLKPSELFGEVAKRGNGDTDNFILEDLTQILRNVEQSTMGYESEDDFEGLFDDLDLTSKKLGKTEKAKNTLIAKILFHLDQINFDLDNTESDVLGDAYEYLIGQFAANAGKKAGEFYTPQQVSKILAKIVTTGKSKLKSVYDPTCGSGSLLLRVTKEVDNVSNFYGQESIHTTYNLARMNMILHDVHYRKFDIKQEDTLERPQHINESFEAIVANPPFSAKWSANELHMSDDRFSQYGRLAPKSKADFAFIQHMIHQLDENGIMAIVCPPGVLYRGAAEGHIRKYLIEDKNYLDAVIGLPENIFYGTGIPTCILVFKKCREDSGNILFIDASNEFKKVKPKNKLISENINKIVNTYRNRKVIQKYSHLASLDEVKGNGYNLNISRYIDAFVRGKAVNLNNIVELSIELDRLSVKNDKRLGEYCAELDLPFPQGNNKNLLKQFRKSITQKIFNQEIRFKSDSGGDFPNWTEKVLGNIGNTFNGLTGKTKKDFGFGKPFIEYVQIFNSTKININNFGLVDVKDDENQKTAQYGDIFFTTSSETPDEVGYSSVLLDVVVDELYLNSFCFGFRPNSPDEINPKFSQYLFRSDEFRRQVRRLAQGSTRYNISKIELMKTAIELPSLKEQIRIAEFLSSIDKKIEQIESQIDASLQNENKLIHRIFE